MRRLRKLSVFTLALVLTSSAALAIPRHEPEPVQNRAAVSSPAEALLSRLLGWLGSAWTKEGCGIDPNGLCPKGSGTTVPPPGSSVDTGGSEGK